MGNAVSASFAKVETLYNNPNDSRFTQVFEKELKNADITITDVNGKRVSCFRANDLIVPFDISSKPAGTYFFNYRSRKDKIFTESN